MNLRIFTAFLLTFLITNSLFSQPKNFSDILPKGTEARPILDSINYLPDTLRQPIFDLINAKGFDLTKCYVDKKIGVNEKDKTISIRIWDIDDLKLKGIRKNHAKSFPIKVLIPIFIRVQSNMT